MKPGKKELQQRALAERKTIITVDPARSGDDQSAIAVATVSDGKITELETVQPIFAADFFAELTRALRHYRHRRAKSREKMRRKRAKAP